MKKLTPTEQLARRAFLRRAGHLSLAGVAAPWAMNLAAMGEAAAAGATDYKALVCIFLYGGNDHANTLVPFDTANYAKYAAIRTSIATPQASLAATVLNPATPLPGGMQLALAPQMSRLKTLFDTGKLAIQLNVGTLVRPTTPEQFNNKTVALPPKLFSHNDQQSLWQSSLPEGSTSGWGGRMSDLMLNSGSNSSFTCISLSGNSVYLSGQNNPCQVTTSGAVAINALKKGAYGNLATAAALQNLITQPSAHLMQDEYTKLTQTSITLESQLTRALSQASISTRFDEANSLAMQLKTVAKLIAARDTLGAKRQVFMVGLGGFDTHDGLVDKHPGLLAAVSEAMASFYEATLELGVANSVTSFTASDFGRTLVSNGDGSDHGWGSHHFVMGGAVKGKRFYGRAPQIEVLGPDHIRGGVLVPSTSVDQYSATLAKWFGVADADLPVVAPNINNFQTKNIGFV